MSRLILALVLVAAALAPAAYGQTARNAAYFELGGSGVIPTINYERRINERWAGRIGFSVVTGETLEDGVDESQTTFIVPLTASWISHPASNHHFEAGGGVTIAAGDRQELISFGDAEDETFSTGFVTGIAGYRYQRPDGGFQFRAVFTPVAGGGDLLPWLGVSFGYAW